MTQDKRLRTRINYLDLKEQSLRREENRKAGELYQKQAKACEQISHQCVRAKTRNQREKCYSQADKVRLRYEDKLTKMRKKYADRRHKIFKILEKIDID